MSLALEKIEQIKNMRSEGYTFREIGRAVGIAHSTARAYGKDYSERRKYISNICHSVGESGLVCKRHKGHRGVHLSDETGKLVYWE